MFFDFKMCFATIVVIFMLISAGLFYIGWNIAASICLIILLFIAGLTVYLATMSDEKWDKDEYLEKGGM